MTALHFACRNAPPTDVIDVFLSIAEDTVQWPDSFGWLPIHYACACGAETEVIKQLAEAFPESKTTVDRRGRTPLHFALGNSSKPVAPDVVVLLSSSGAAGYADDNGMLVSSREELLPFLREGTDTIFLSTSASAPPLRVRLRSQRRSLVCPHWSLPRSYYDSRSSWTYATPFCLVQCWSPCRPRRRSSVGQLQPRHCQFPRRSVQSIARLGRICFHHSSRRRTKGVRTKVSGTLAQCCTRSHGRFLHRTPVSTRLVE